MSDRGRSLLEQEVVPTPGKSRRLGLKKFSSLKNFTAQLLKQSLHLLLKRMLSKTAIILISASVKKSLAKVRQAV
jgi:hypothetical protein